MSEPNICYVVASKDSTGEYIPENDVITDIEEAVQFCMDLFDADPASDPRIVQVILDPEHPSVRVSRLIKALEAKLETGSAADYDGLETAIEIAKEQQGVINLDELESGGKK